MYTAYLVDTAGFADKQEGKYILWNLRFSKYCAKDSWLVGCSGDW